MSAGADLLRYVATILTTVLGIVALLIQARDEHTRRLTIGAKCLLCGIVLTGVVAVAIQFSDSQAAESRARLESEQVRITQDQLTKASYTLRDNFILTFYVTAEGAGPEFLAYYKFLKDTGLGERKDSHMACTSISPSYLPAMNREPAVFWLTNAGVTLFIYRTPISPEQFSVFLRMPYDAPNPDLILYSGSDRIVDKCVVLTPGQSPTSFDILTFATSKPLNSSDIISSGSITSLPDLEDAQLFVVVSRAPGRLESIKVSFGFNGTLTLSKEKLIEHDLDEPRGRRRYSNHFYEYRMPGDFTDILAQLRAEPRMPP